MLGPTVLRVVGPTMLRPFAWALRDGSLVEQPCLIVLVYLNNCFVGFVSSCNLQVLQKQGE